MIPSWKCETCGKKFSAGEWTCADGQSHHIVERKEYLTADAPSDPGHPASGGMDSKRDGRLRICNIPPDKTVIVNGETRIQPGGYVEFIRGRFASTDPEVQYCLDKKGGFVTEDQWTAAWLSDNQQLELERMKLKALGHRLENERNELLAKVKESKERARPSV